MAKDNKKLVQAITSQEENFAQWYTDICVKAELVEYSSVKGFIILRPYGQAIWELIQKDMDARFKATGHENVAMPVLIPESLLQKEKDHVEGFAPECAWVTIGGSDAWYMIGHAYFDRAFSEHFREILEAEYDLPQTRDKLWENLYIEHLSEFDMTIRRYENPIIHEFDSLDELQEFDPLFLENLDSEIFDNIVAVLGCEKSEIHDVYPLKQGITNLSCHFATNDGEWVYRHPGIGTELLIDRNAEKAALETAAKLGLDDTFVFENPRRGWKISKFVVNCKNLDAHNGEQLDQAMRMARKLHESNAKVERSFSFYDEGRNYERSLLARGPISVNDWQEMSDQAAKLNEYLVADGGEPVLCHNDFFGLNFLIDEDGNTSLIDWEYAGMGDYANDFGTFCVCEQLSEDEMLRALTSYFDRTPTDVEWRHNLGQVGMAGWCWYAWSLLKESEGDNVGEWAYIYYRHAKTYLKKALDLYEAAGK